MMKTIARSILYIIGVTALLSSCTSQTKYYHYEHTPVAGWEKNDTISFDVPPLKQEGEYGRTVNLRITGLYPFMKLTLIVETDCMGRHLQKGRAAYARGAYGGKKRKGNVSCDTLKCTLVSNEGRATGYGVSNYQYQFSMPPRHYHAGDSLHITIRHDMKREILPGISDVGLRLYREGE